MVKLSRRALSSSASAVAKSAAKAAALAKLGGATPVAAVANVSRRGAAAPLMLPTYLSDARGVEKFDAATTPDGVLQLSVAENQLITDLLVPKLRSLSAAPSATGEAAGLFEASMIYYQTTHGMVRLRSRHK